MNDDTADQAARTGRAGPGRRRSREKHLAFYRLVEACAEPECPVCSLSRRRVEQYFDGLLYEKVNDRELRERFRSAGGFCNPHSFQFVGYHDALAASILYRDLLLAWLQEPCAVPAQASNGVLPDCPVCREKAKSEEGYLALLGDFLEDAQLKQALLSCDGFCLPHFSALECRQRRGRNPLPAWLMDMQRRRIESIAADLAACVDSSNFSLGSKRPPLGRDTEVAWKKAVHKTAGFPARAPGS